MSGNTTKQIAKHFREVYFGGNWTCSNLKDSLADVTWQNATTKVHSLNTIAALVFHINYYVEAVLKVLKGEALDSHDKYSFDVPVISSQEEWQNLLDKSWADAEEFALLVEELADEMLWKTFSEEKYGIYYRNLHGVIEHTHYHLGQIALVKKIVIQKDALQ